MTATKTKAWATGTGSVTITYGGSGDGSIVITSDNNNLHEARSMVITVKTTSGSPTVTKTVTVNQAAKPYIDLTNAVVTAANQTYNGSAKTPTPTVTLNGETVPSIGYDVAYSNNTNAGTATITITGKGDYTGTATGTFTIAQATGQVTTAPTARTITYTGSGQYLVTAGSGTGTMYYRYRYKSYTASSWGSWSSYSTSRPSRTDAGYYEVQYYAAASSDGNYTASSTGSVSVTMNRASRTVSWSSHPSTLNEGDTGNLSAYVSAGSGDGSISFSSSNSSIASVSGSTVTGVSEGSCTIYASVSAGTNYNSASTSYTLSVNGSDYVDLGLSVKWRKFNLGGSLPSDSGLYYSWGDNNGYASGAGHDFSWASYGPPEANISSDITPTQDAAYNATGGDCRIPTTSEFSELISNCSVTRTTQNNVYGIKFTSKINGKSIFLPAAGEYDGATLRNYNSEGSYWSTQYISASSAGYMTLSSSNVTTSSNGRRAGCSIRPVKDI